MGTGPDRKQGGCRLVVGTEEAAAARAAWPDAPIVALVEASDPTQAVLARTAGADVVLPTDDLAAGWRDDMPGLALAVSAASSLAKRRVAGRDSARRSAHDLGQALSAINLAGELALGDRQRNERLLQQIKAQAHDAGVHAWRAGRAGRAAPSALRPLDLASVLHRTAVIEPDVVVYDSTGSAQVLGDEPRLAQLLEELIQHGRRSAATQRITVAYGDNGTVELILRGVGSPRSSSTGADPDFSLLSLGEGASDMGGALTVEPPTGSATHPEIRLSLPLVPDDDRRVGRVEIPPDRMAIQTAILEGVLRHAPLSESMEAIVAAIEQQLPGTTCSVLLLGDEGCLSHCAGAGLPEAYRDEIDGVAIGYGQGSCGTAAYLGRPVIAADVETDRHWTGFKQVALAHGLRSCWSTPILAADGGSVLGTFAVYHREVWRPDAAAIRLVSRFTYLAAVAIGHHRLFNAVAESESRFRSAFEGATVGMALVDLDGDFLMVNPALRGMLGGATDRLSNRNVLNLVEPAHRGLITDDWDLLLSATGPKRDIDRDAVEVPIVSHPGRDPLWVSLRSSLVVGDDGGRPSVYIEIRDITASRRHQVERRAREAAEAASRAKSDLLASVSHELRTPLNAILGFTQVMQMVELDPSQRADSLQSIIEAGRHLLELINELLDLSMIEAGRLPTDVEEVDAADVIDEALRILRPLADSRQIALRRNLGGHSIGSASAAQADRPVVLRADRQCVRQVLINLVGNAVKFTPPGGEVEIEVIPSVADDRIRISVLDSGPGIPSDAIDDLFQPFHRLLPDSRPGTEGTGLGLSVSARLVEEMQGRIGAESTVGIGSCFWVDLPGFVRPERSTPRPTTGPGRPDDRPKPDVGPADRRATKGTMLYVEDDPACVRVVAAALALRPKIDLMTAADAAAGLATVNLGSVDLVLLDIGLPDGSGWDMLRSLRANPETAAIPVVVLTAGTGVAPAEGPLPDRIMTKPLDIGDCIAAIDELMPAATGTNARSPRRWGTAERIDPIEERFDVERFDDHAVEPAVEGGLQLGG